MSVTIAAPDATWRIRAAELIAELHGALGPLALRIEHIGSTSIPGMAAKAVYDLQVSVADLDEAVAAFDAPLAGLGLFRKPYEHDHVPAGRADSPGRWRKRYWSRTGDEPVHLHVRLVGSPNERLALLFRDWFRDRPDAVAAYSAFKTALAAAVTDPDVYTDVKDPVVDLVAAAAEEWAATTAWTPTPAPPAPHFAR
ncbi:GrpB family protein [Dactylosporangium roseum]|uniref:GrpB family protein n=1 Tax=Dactylosporangium roseum TaxID=47989 RepID=A0ABY5YZU8_9ACTN|nr:GrpB family protein [Dactylosporangium roseum]UWZ33764.1 GrpB family protein [Dactylosporangium roseum]